MVNGVFNCFTGASRSYEVTDEDIESGQFKECFDRLGTSNVYSMTISGSVSSLPSNLLSGMDNLNYFRLLDCPNLVVIEEGIFDDLEYLEEIELDRCNCPDLLLTPGVLMGSVATELKLSNYGPSIFEDALIDVDLVELEKLFVSNNSLDSLPVDAFDHMPKIDRIYLSNNNFEKFPVEALNDISSLEDVVFMDNNLVCLPTGLEYDVEAHSCLNPCMENGEPECESSYLTEDDYCFGWAPLCDDVVDSEGSSETGVLCDQIDCSSTSHVKASFVIAFFIGLFGHISNSFVAEF